MKILVVDDEPLARRLLEATLRKEGHEVAVTENAVKAVSYLEEYPDVQVIISDWIMPGMDGLELCQHVRRQHSDSYRFFMLISSKEGKESLLEGLAAGADDFLHKPLDPVELLIKLHIAQRILGSETAMLKIQAELKDLLLYDALTGVRSRRAIYESLKGAWSIWERHQKPFSVLMGDVDLFKQINDAHGHQNGDAVLVEVAHRIQGSCRPSDQVGRYGGEEFLVVLNETGEADARAVAERIRHAISAQPMHGLGGLEIPVTLSMGVACVASGGCANYEQLVASADQAMYQAKQGGRNLVV